jgi:hypothetical protein
MTAVCRGFHPLIRPFASLRATFSPASAREGEGTRGSIRQSSIECLLPHASGEKVALSEAKGRMRGGRWQLERAGMNLDVLCS